MRQPARERAQLGLTPHAHPPHSARGRLASPRLMPNRRTGEPVLPEIAKGPRPL